MNRKKALAFILVGLMLLTLLAGCSASNMGAADMATSVDEEDVQYSQLGLSNEAKGTGAEPSEAPAADSERGDTDDAGSASQSLPEDITTRKLIYNGTLSIESLDFDASIAYIEQKAGELGGYIESSSVSNGNNYYYDEDGKYSPLRSASYVLRIPYEQFGAFMDGSGNIGHVLTTATNVNDISATYYDTQARLESLQTMETRLLELLAKSETLNDAIALEQSLADTRYEIESLTGTLRIYDSLISYSTVTIYIDEVVNETEIDTPEPEPDTLGGRIIARLGDTFENIAEGGADFIVWFIASLPYIIIWVVVIFLIFLAVRAVNRKRRRSRQAMQTPPPADKKQGDIQNK